MDEELLQYIWNYKIFENFNFTDTDGNPVEILDFGVWNKNSGPDFSSAKIKTKNLVLAGNIELHLKSSDWDLHRHSADRSYENVILHAVFFHDRKLPELTARNVPTVELKNYISPETLKKYDELLNVKKFVPCEEIFTPEKIPFGFAESLLLQKLEEKSEIIYADLKRNKNDFEAVLFHNLAYSFGLKINAEIFRQISESVDFSVIRKISNHRHQLEALFFGISGWLEDAKDPQTIFWQKEFKFLQSKFGVSNQIISPKFLRLRPPNFPTLRLSQLADLYHREQNLFSKIISAKTTGEILSIFSKISASDYWDNHYNFGKESPQNSRKTVTKEFINLMIINAVLPLKYAVMKHKDENIADEILQFYEDIPAEKNTILDGWKSLGVAVNSAKDSQAWLYLYKNFCTPKKCLNCSIGLQLLKNK